VVNRFAVLSKSKPVLVALVAAVVLALAGTTFGYASLRGEKVSLSLDGQTQTVRTDASTVGELLEDEDIDVSERDIIAPGLDEKIDDGDRVSVKFARQLELNVDGRAHAYWVTSNEVGSALDEIGRRFRGADLSASRGADISRDGMTLEVITPKKLTLVIGKQKATKQAIAGLTVRDVLQKVGANHDKDDIVKPRLGRKVSEGDKITVVHVRAKNKNVSREKVPFDTVTKEDSSMPEGEEKTTREGQTGLRDVTYRIEFRNGQFHGKKVVSQKVLKEPVDEVVVVGTKEEPEVPTGGANFASGGTVWDQLAECESGGNWAINTGNGYYGGLQFNLDTWHSYGGPGYPHEQSRETQIAIAEKVRAATGGYGSWPHCSQQLGLPQ